MQRCGPVISIMELTRAKRSTLWGPEKVFAVCWKYNPDVTIQRATKGWIFDTPGFDNWYIDMYNKVIEDETSTR